METLEGYSADAARRDAHEAHTTIAVLAGGDGGSTSIGFGTSGVWFCLDFRSYLRSMGTDEAAR